MSKYGSDAWIDSGVSSTLLRENRNIRVTNFIALSISLCISVIVAFRYISGALELWFYLPLMIEALLFLSLIVLSKKGLSQLSRVLICWIPSVALIADVIVLVSHVQPETSHYLGFRIFQISFSFFPFLVFNLSEKKRMALGLSVPMFCMLFYDRILDFAGVGYSDAGLTDSTYYYNNLRTLLSVALLAAAFIFLKRILEKQEVENEQLIRALAEKNILIKASAERELKKAYERLSFHINNTPLAVVEIDRNFQIMFWNKRAEEMFGWTADEVIGKRHQYFVVDPRDLRLATEKINTAVAEKRDSDFMEVRTVAKDGRISNCLWYYSFLRDERGNLETVLSFISDITKERKASYALNERIKELGALYNVSQLLTTRSKTMHEVFEGIPALLPPGWQYPEVCAARFTVFDTIYQTENFHETPFLQSSDLEINNRTIGQIEVVYLEETPAEDEGPFLKEERFLLVAIAQMLKVYIERTLEEDDLQKTKANLSAIINNTEIMMWSVDLNFNIITYNEVARKFANDVLKVRVDRGEQMPAGVTARWRERYQRVLTGEVITAEETVHGIDFRYSLSPIIENAVIIGITVFADNVTDRNEQLHALTSANKKISELKVMALRSVMNPHFIFNVLSSIQYFITRNDELNAINYLTAFSKLMRTVLTRSVADSVTLKEEIDLLKDYVHLEKLRFEGKFDFSVSCEGIDPDTIRVPSLLIQPYVENAILHGLCNKEDKGSLRLTVREEDQFVIFEVEDDGIGREAANVIQKKNPSERKSMGTQLTEERLTLLNNNDPRPAVVFTDLYNKGVPAGTRVTISIKINPD